MKFSSWSIPSFAVCCLTTLSLAGGTLFQGAVDESALLMRRDETDELMMLDKRGDCNERSKRDPRRGHHHGGGKRQAGKFGGGRFGGGAKGGNKGGNKGGGAAAGGQGGAASSAAGGGSAASSAAGATASGAAGATGGNDGTGAGGGGGGGGSVQDDQSSLTLNPNQVQKGFALDGNQVPAAGQAASATSTNNFINFCETRPDLPLTNGAQVKTGSCNAAPMGIIAATTNMPASKFQNPTNLQDLAANQDFDIKMAVQHLQTGTFVNAASNYYSAPANTNNAGDIIGHSHFVIQKIQSISTTQINDPNVFAFFKGVNSAAVNGVLTETVKGGLAAGTYKLSSINSAANHQPCLVAVAQHGDLDDTVYFTVGQGANGAAAAASGNAAGGAGAAAASSAAGGGAAAASVSTTAAAAAASAAKAGTGAGTGAGTAAGGKTGGKGKFGGLGGKKKGGKEKRESPLVTESRLRKRLAELEARQLLALDDDDA